MGKGASLIAQLILGWLLAKEDFALYAIAISWSTIVMALRNGGTQRLLIQKGTQYSDLAVMYLKFALLFNVVGFAILMAAAPILSGLYDSHSLRVMVWILGLSLPLSTAAMIFQAKLSADLEFAKVSRLIILSSLARHGSMVVFAWLGLGPLSFVLPLCVVALVETALGWYWARRWPPNRPLTWPSICGIFQDSRWVMLTALASALTINGDYLAISLLQSKELLGVYFFGYQLSLALVALVTSSLDTVMMPTFSSLGHETSRQTDLFVRGTRLLAVVSTFACFGLALAAPAAIHGLWGGKWDEAIPVVQILSLAMPVRLMIPLCRAMLEARGQWRLVSVLSISDGIGITMAGAVGALEAVIVIYGIQAVMVGLAYLLRWQSDTLIFAMYGAFATAMFALFVTTERRRVPLSVSSSGRVLSDTKLARAGLWLSDMAPRFLAVVVPFFLVANVFLPGHVPTDVGFAAISLFVVVMAGPWFMPQYRSHFVRGGLYVGSAFLMYMGEQSGMSDIWPIYVTYNTLLALIALLVLLSMRFSRGNRFQTTPLDYLMVFFALIVPLLPEMRADMPTLSILAAKLIVLYFSFELLLHTFTDRVKQLGFLSLWVLFGLGVKAWL
ncbi:MAG: oligosaccharide flippase family protein [Nitrospira sp.]|nr:oligosaccharide flippase family protein [Nitrospira sp.]